MSETDTPRTDAARKGSGGAGRFVELCEVLERELAQAQARIEELEKALKELLDWATLEYPGVGGKYAEALNAARAALKQPS